MNSRRKYAAFTLLELLTVIAIIGIIAALAAPTLSHFRKGDAMLSATREMLDGVARARQLAISGRTTVYMVFVPPGFWRTSATNTWGSKEWNVAINLAGKQFVGYNFISLHSVGDQPGQRNPRYLSSWQTLPETSFIPPWKFTDPRTFVPDSSSPLFAVSISLHRSPSFSAGFDSGYSRPWLCAASLCRVQLPWPACGCRWLAVGP